MEKGIKEICFTEHFSVNPQAPTYGHMNFNKYLKDINYCKKTYSNDLTVKMGIELCEPHLFTHTYSKSLQTIKLDFILGSVHNINNQKLRQVAEKSDAPHREYFEELYKMVCIADIDVLAHLDLMKRYHSTIGLYDFHEFKWAIEQILKKAIERNIGIEINTSGLRVNLQQILPSINIVKLYKDLGGEILTIGSDSHTPEAVGSNIYEAINIAKECGFRHIFKFENRIPIPIEV
ncbi:histidinol-phosphatase HisJ family protein [Neobacillus niacini]|uniref:histidinol-phosphatase HisJ family protein n=1 Tax=Neobacillus niacini TaxID=86668 RepID=UPI002FFF7D08